MRNVNLIYKKKRKKRVILKKKRKKVKLKRIIKTQLLKIFQNLKPKLNKMIKI